MYKTTGLVTIQTGQMYYSKPNINMKSFKFALNPAFGHVTIRNLLGLKITSVQAVATPLTFFFFCQRGFVAKSGDTVKKYLNKSGQVLQRAMNAYPKSFFQGFKSTKINQNGQFLFFLMEYFCIY